MRYFHLLWLSALLGGPLAAQITQVDAFSTGTKITYLVGRCGGPLPPAAQGKLTFCDGAGNLGVVMESRGLGGNSVAGMLPNHYDAGEVYLTFRRGLSIRRPDGTWDNLPNIAIPDSVSGRSRNQAQVASGLVTADGKLVFGTGTSGQSSIYTYDLTTRRITRVPVPGFKNPDVFAYDTDRNLTWVLASTQGDVDLFTFDGTTLEFKGEVPELDRAGLTTTSTVRYADSTLYVGTDQGLFTVNLKGSNYPVTQYDATKTGKLPFDQVKDFDFGGRYIWLAQSNLNNGAIVRYDTINDTYEQYSLATPGSPTIPLKFTTLAVNNAGLVSAVASNYFGIIDLDFANNLPRWRPLPLDSLPLRGVTAQSNPNHVYFRNGRFYYTAFNGSTAANSRDEVLIRDGDAWTARSDDAPGNISARMASDFTQAVPDSKGGMWWFNPGGSAVVYFDKNEQLRAIYNQGVARRDAVVDQDDRAVFVGTGFRPVRKIYFPLALQLKGQPINQQLLARRGNQVWTFENNTGVLRAFIGGALAQAYQLDATINYGNFYTFAADAAGNAWLYGSAGALVRYNPATNTTTQITAPYDPKEAVKALAAPGGGMWFVGKEGVLYYDGTTFYPFLTAAYPSVRDIYDATVDTTGTLHLETGFAGRLVTISNPTAAAPVVTERNVNNDLLPAENLFGSSVIALDAGGDVWLHAGQTFYRLIDANRAAAYVPGGVGFTLSGHVYVDENQNDTFDEGEQLPGQAVTIKVGDKILQTFTDAAGKYTYLLQQANTNHQLLLPMIADFFYAPYRLRNIAVGAIDRNYPNNDFPLLPKNYSALHFKTANKEGAWGFIREGFENTFTMAVTNLSYTKAFNGLKVSFFYANKAEDSGNVLPDVDTVVVTRLKPVSVPYVTGDLVIDPRSHRWAVTLPDSTYQRTGVTLPPTIRATDDTVEVTLTIPALRARETYVVEVKTALFDPTKNRTTIIYGPYRTESEDLGDGGEIVFAPLGDPGVLPFPDDPIGVYIPPTGDVPIFLNPGDPPSADGPPVFLDPSDPPESLVPVFLDPGKPSETSIRSSIDPNDKLVDGGLPTGINETDLGSRWLGYTIRFENTGNFSAKDIYVLDTLDAQIDPYSLKVLEASHAFQADLLPDTSFNIVRFSFNDIYLPFEDDQNDGWVRFRVRTDTTLKGGDIVRNRAAIYFDQNPPIITNTVQNQFLQIIISSLPAAEPVAVTVYPNPTVGQLTVSSDVPVRRISFHDVQGRLVREVAAQTTFSVAGVPRGVYFLRIHTDRGVVTRKVVLQ